MYLAPHHFQAQNRYFEDSVYFTTSSLWQAPYGLTSCQLDEEAVQNGMVALVHARGMFSDGLPFEIPACDPVPEPLPLAPLLQPSEDRLTIALSIPRRNPDGANCSLEADPTGSPYRFVSTAETVLDENTGRDEKELYLGRKNIRLVPATQAGEDLLTLPIARVLRDTTHAFAFDPTFIPPCIKVSASPRLLSFLRRLVDILEEKSSAVSQARPGRGSLFRTGLSSGHIAHFWFLHSVNTSLAALRHLLLTRQSHPQQLYLEMARLAGALCTFGVDSHPRTLPHYDHDRMDACFEALDDHIRRHLEIIVPSQAISIPLKEAPRYFHSGTIGDDRCLGPSRWVLGIQASVGEADLITKVPQLVKVCSKQFVPELVKRALPGLTLTHLSVPPAAIAARVESQYFAISKSGPCWEHVLKTKNIGVYVPGELPKPELELTILLET
jgi:type VI secretion system protein ImpJ